MSLIEAVVNRLKETTVPNETLIDRAIHGLEGVFGHSAIPVPDGIFDPGKALPAGYAPLTQTSAQAPANPAVVINVPVVPVATANYSLAFQIAINRVLAIEGGLVENPADPGGLTNWGISQRNYPTVNVRYLAREQAVEIYHQDVWTKVGADAMPGAIAYQLLDFAVNSGGDTAIRKLQTAVGVADDGHWGPVSAKAAAMVSVHDLVMRYLAERLDFLRKLKNWPTFGAGWAGRVAQDLRYAAADS